MLLIYLCTTKYVGTAQYSRVTSYIRTVKNKKTKIKAGPKGLVIHNGRHPLSLTLSVLNEWASASRQDTPPLV